MTWNEVAPIDQNGVITMYEVMYTPLEDFGGQISANTTNVSGLEQSVFLNYLQEYVNYTITVRAYTQEGPGLSSSEMTVLTSEAGKILSCTLLNFISFYCFVCQAMSDFFVIVWGTND